MENYYSIIPFIAGYSVHPYYHSPFIVWLRGGGTTYYYRSDKNRVTLRDASASPKEECVGVCVTYDTKTSVDSNVPYGTYLDRNLTVSALCLSGDCRSTWQGINEIDPTVPAWIKDGISWYEIPDKPAGFADNVDDVGITIESDPTVLWSVKDGVSWSELSGVPGNLTYGNGSANYLTKWTGTYNLGNSLIYDDGAHVEINGSQVYPSQILKITNSNSGHGIFAVTDSTDWHSSGLTGRTTGVGGAGVRGESLVAGAAPSGFGMGVVGHATYNGNTQGLAGVFGQVDAYCTSCPPGATTYPPAGVIGYASNSTGTSVGVFGKTNSSSGYAGLFYGRVYVNGNLDALTVSSNVKNFKIDHPLDPQNKYLIHASIESPEMKNFYDGIAVLNENGETWVELPEWFEALNKDFRYQLTCIGGFVPVYIAEEISNNRFKISGGQPGMKVSWQVTGIRHDTWAEEHPMKVEVEK